MICPRRTLPVIAAALFMTSAGPALAADAFNAAQRKEIETIIHQYILDNPGIVFEAADKHQANMAQKADAEAKKVLKEKEKELFENKSYGILGNNSAKVPFVEFYDYNCGYCKHAFPDLVKVTSENKDIKVILIDTPILGPGSFEAAKWSIAAQKLGKGVEFHKAVMDFAGPKDEPNLTDIVKKLGLDPAKVKEMANDKSTQEQIDKNMGLFSALGLSGTPGFVTSDRVIRGAVGADVIQQIAKEILQKK